VLLVGVTFSVDVYRYLEELVVSMFRVGSKIYIQSNL
jgi:hypothetical protein